MSEQLPSNHQGIGTIFRTGRLFLGCGTYTEEREWVDADEYRQLRRRYDEGVIHQQELNSAYESDIAQLQLAVTAAHADRTRELGQMRQDFAGVVEENHRLRAELERTKHWIHENERLFARAISSAGTNQVTMCGPDDHLYAARAGSPIGDGVCIKCGAKEQPHETGEKHG